MHYGDPEQLEQNEFQFVVYKHEDRQTARHLNLETPGLGAFNPSEPEAGVWYQLTSIHKCQFVRPALIAKFFRDWASEKKFQRQMSVWLRNQPTESWNLVTMKEDDRGRLSLTGFSRVREDHTSFYHIH